jgi:hypothetical protein
VGRATIVFMAIAVVAAAAAIALYAIGGSWQSNEPAYACAFASAAAAIAAFLSGFAWLVMWLVRRYTERRFGTQIFRKPRA